MTITADPNSFAEKLNDGSAHTIPDAFRKMKMGNVVRALPTTLRKKDPAASSYQLATLEALTLADEGKAHAIFRAYARAGAVTGELAVQAYGATPLTGQIAVAPNGDIVVLAADAITDLDVVYLPEKYDVKEISLPVATHVLTIPANLTTPGVVMLLEAEAEVGTSVGKKIVLVPGAGAPAAGQARLNIAKTTVTFAVADAVTKARVKLAVSSDVDLDALLEAKTNLI